ncbi:LysM peptidoglycan-binding domain-containing protein [bacterium]|nr:LysM peptidoglycan-binding domain-containing protein [bacterium]
MRKISFILLTLILITFNVKCEEYNFNNSILSVSTINNSSYKRTKINKFINYFTKTEKGRVFFKQTYRRQGYFRDRIEEIFDEYNIPVDLIYLSMIESGFQVDVRSSAGAVGLWQFMPSTGRIFGLRVDKWIDERKDFEKSTYAAVKYLRSLKKKFGSWELAMAGYNSGDLTVRDAIVNHKSRDFWYLSQHTFPKQTKDYVPQILAVIHISKNLNKFGFSNKILSPMDQIEKVELPPQTSLNYIAKISDISYSRLKKMNPSLLRDITPPDTPYSIYVPAGLKKKVYAKLYSNPVSKVIFKYKVKKGDTLSKIGKLYSNKVSEIIKLNDLDSSLIYIGQDLLVYKKVYFNEEQNNNDSFTYLVKKGDSLSMIAKRFNIKTKELKEINNLPSNKIQVGQTLKIIKSNE